MTTLGNRLNANNNFIKLVPDPIQDQDAVNKRYVDGAIIPGVGLLQDPPVDGDFLKLIVNQPLLAGTYTDIVDLKSFELPVVGAKIAILEVYLQQGGATTIDLNLAPAVIPSIVSGGYIYKSFTGAGAQQYNAVHVPLFDESFEWEMISGGVGTGQIYLLGWLY